MSMPSARAWGWFKEVSAPSGPPPEDLGHRASLFLGSLYTDAHWDVVERELERLASDNSIDSILERQREALAGIRNRVDFKDLKRLTRSARPQELPAEDAKELLERDAAERSLTYELQEAAAEYEASEAELAEQLPRAAQEAAQIPADSTTAKAAARIAEAIRGADLTPAWMAVLLWWLLVMPSEKQLGALTLWFMVVTEVMKNRKKDGG
jgi:hypothetical protein